MEEKANATKIQHFVPQFFQRYFSYNFNQKTIGMFNVNNEIFINSTSIRTQLYGDYLYGKSGELENWLSNLETRSAPIFRKMWEAELLPKIESEDQLIMLHFLLILDIRNPIRLDVIKKFRKLIGETNSSVTGRKLPSELMSAFELLEGEQGKKMFLLNAVKIVPDLVDLKYKLIKNTSDLPFIISDNPLIIYNQFMEKRKWNIVSQRGYGSIGLQMFLPINEKYMLIVYDSSIYKVGNKKENVVEIDENESINQLNMLQFLNSTDTINFNHLATENYIRKLFEKSKRFKKANEAFINIHKIDDGVGGIKPLEEVIESGVTDLKINLNIQKVKILTKSVAIKLDNRLAQTRKGIELNKNNFLKTQTIK